MGCGSSKPTVQSAVSTVSKIPKQFTKGSLPKLDIDANVPSTSFRDFDSVDSNSQNDQSYSCDSYKEWRDVISFPTFMTQSEKPQIFEYEFIKSIGRGAQAEVYLVKNVETGEFLAAKVYDKNFLYRNNLGDAEQPIQKTIREIQIMSSLNHPNCMSLVEVLDDDYTNTIIIIFPYADGGSLLPQSLKTKPIPEERAKFYFYQIACGVKYIHEHNIIHRDIKPENIMKFSGDRIVLADFSASVVLDSPDELLEDTDGTPAFYSPEQCTGKPYEGKPTDIWACGVSLYILLYGKLPFFDVTDDDFFLSQFFKIAHQIQHEEVNFDPNIQVSNESKDLISHCLEKDAKKRYTIEDVLKHPWLESCYNDPVLIRIEEKNSILVECEES
ncbi:hypothetical protein M9Y10_028606 [Tritrichomonas musculus]|uniref:Protein kinase domain-containing protein n=1 Tax=Tritrichomonas musculus TaxID=1915356 RepID=A0ABR2KJT2_9EUKA